MEFRGMRRFKQQLSEEECRDILIHEPRGVLSLNGDGGYPYGVPVDFLYDQKSGKLYFHGAKDGHKVDALMKDPRASFCVYEKGCRKPDDWAYDVRSVICFGKIRPVEDEDLAREMCYQIGIKYYPSEDMVQEELNHAFARVLLLEFTIEHMTGKLVHER